MSKKHFVAIHTCFSEEGRRAFIDLTKDLTHQELIDSCRTEDAEMIAQWMGKDDFFYCHWYAESEESINEVLENLGVDKICVTAVNEMSRYVTSKNPSSKLVGDPDKIIV